MEQVFLPAVRVGKQIIGIVHFSIDRWVGIEGVMAVSAYPHLSRGLFLKAIVEPAIKSEPSIYSMIAPWPDQQGSGLKKNVNFMSLPGGIAFLYLSGSFLALFVIMALLVVALQYSEMLAHMATRNPILSAVVGWSMSLMLAHFGGSPRSQLPTLMFLFISITLICAIESRWAEALFNRVRSRF